MVLTALLTVAFVALAATAPAAAVRSGPDVALRAGVDVLPVSDGGGQPVSDGDARSRWTDGPEIGYVPPIPGVDPPSGVEHLFDPPEEEWGAGHRGADLTAPAGSRVLSPGPGVVTFAGQVAWRGVVMVTHPDGLSTSLEPVAASVPVGTAVVAGSAIGVVEGGADEGRADDSAGGTTPNHCAPRSCVHWGVRRGERYIDPLSLLHRPPIVLLPDH
ncbi:M23 family metallopeptidase [Promicromonospora sp. NPDC090134]|uniref:M23 family metallopeptidase n=1 Tax=Promicromonospora sp. NPDC090134 TaxID=3364408 RepID=UPI00380F81D8